MSPRCVMWLYAISLFASSIAIAQSPARSPASQVSSAQQESPVAKDAHPKQTEASEGKSKSDVDVLARTLAGLSLVITLASLIYAINKDKRARRHSVEDDFWVRSVIGPLTIEPLIGTIFEVCKSLPDPSESLEANIRRERYDELLRSYKLTHQETISRLMLLTILSAGLYRDTSRILDEIEDILTEHCSDNRAIADPSLYVRGTYASREAVIVAIHSKLRMILEKIRDRQHAL